MLRRLASIFTIISFVFLSLFFAPKSFGATDTCGNNYGCVTRTTSACINNGGEEASCTNSAGNEGNCCLPTAPIPTPTTVPTNPADDLQSDIDGMLQDFCAKRSGDQMNLETWYSGKCQDDSMSGDGVGFSDIIILDFAERIMGRRTPEVSPDVKYQELYRQFRDLNTDVSMTPEQKDLALNEARTNFFVSQGNTFTTQVGKLMSYLVNTHPASTPSYIAYVKDNLVKNRIISPALAASPTVQGAGFSTMSPFIPLWKVTRNFAYTLLVIVFIAYGFMMMFRVNLGQKTVISVQLAIPKLIVTFLIITFSYAIVGLILDLMWVVIWFVFYYLHSNNLIALGNPFVWASSGRGGMVFSWLWNSIVASAASPGIVSSILIGGPSLIGSAVGGVLAFVAGGWVIAIIIAIAVLISYAKLFGKLITSFVSIIVSLVLAPLILLGNAFPGSTSIGTWFRGILANASVFPVTMILLLFSYILMAQPLVSVCPDTWTNITAGDSSNLGQPGVGSLCEIVFGVRNLNPGGFINTMPLITPVLGNVGWGFAPDSLMALIGIVLLLMASKYVDIVKDALKVPPFKYGTDITNALKMGIQYVPSTPGVGKRIGESKAYQDLAGLANVKPVSLNVTQPAGRQRSAGDQTVEQNRGATQEIRG